MASCQVNIDGTDYYIPCDQINNLELINNQLVNVGSSNITLKSNFVVQGNSYPYISCNSLSVCRLYRETNQQYTTISSAPVYSGDPFLTFSYGYVISVLLLIILGVRLVWKK